MTMPKHFRDLWMQFCDGEWTKTAPTEEGAYFIADHKGDGAGILRVVRLGPGAVIYVKPGSTSEDVTEVWEGWFWNKSIAELPPFPLANQSWQAIQATRRPDNFEELDASHQWAIDKRLGILDWAGE